MSDCAGHRGLIPSLSICGQADEKTRVGQWDHRSFVEATLVTDQPVNLYNEYQKTITLTGTDDTIDLELDYPFEIQRVNLKFEDVFEKTFSVDIHGHKSGNSNATILSYSNHFDQNYESTVERIFLYPRFLRIDVADNATNKNRKFDATVVTRELPLYRGRKKDSENKRNSMATVIERKD